VKNQIVEKLNRFLKIHYSLHEECEVMYLMIELRKLLDHEEEVAKKYPLVRFYADWSVHTQKDIITDSMRQIMEKVDSMYLVTDYGDGHHSISMKKDINLDFILMPELRNEMGQMFSDFSIISKLTIDNNWTYFVRLLSRILADQPMINPTKRIEKFYYLKTRRREVIVAIDFRKPIPRCLLSIEVAPKKSANLLT